MKNILTLGLFFLLTLPLFSQTDGINYQAVIIGPDKQELPGVDAQGNILPNATVAIRFTIYDANNTVEYQEVQTTNTDQYGRINLMIGAADHDAFTKISWDGTNKDLKVEIDFKGGSNYVDMSREQLSFLPFAFHRNITATGTLTVDDATFLNGELTVQLPTNLNSTLDVNNESATNLSGSLTVKGAAVLDSTLVVNNKNISHLTGALNVGDNFEPVENGPYDEDAPTKLNGTLDVVGLSSTNGLTNKGTFSSDVLKGQILEVSGPITEGDKDRLLGDNKDQTTILKGNTTIGVADKNNPNLYNDKLTIDGDLEINTQNDLIINADKQVIITSELLEEDDKDINNYPLVVEGGYQGIAIKVAGTAKNRNNFVSFWDDTPVSSALPKPPLEALSISGLFSVLGLSAPFEGFTSLFNGNGNTVSGEHIADYPNAPMLWGRIEGETDESEFINNADYNLDRLGAVYDVVDGALDLAWQTIDLIKEATSVTAAATAATPCVGFGACVAAPPPSNIAATIANLALEVVKEIAAIANEAFATRNLVVFDYNKSKFRGVSYASGAGDYAEYLIRADINETMSYGDIVGVKGGKISKITSGAQRMMVISYKPIVLGALPQPGLEKFYEKVAFMGQIPVKVYGKVEVGDYIVPSGKNDGLGIAISPSKITPKDVKNIIGVSWEAIDFKFGFNFVNVAVGLNSNDTSPFIEKLEKQIIEQNEELIGLKKLLAETINRLVVLENNTLNSNVLGSHIDEISAQGESSDGRKYEIENDVIYFDITDADIENGLKLAKKMMEDDGVDIEKHLVWKKIKEEPGFKQKLTNSLKEKLGKQIHYHKDFNKKGGQ